MPILELQENEKKISKMFDINGLERKILYESKKHEIFVDA